MKNGTVKNHTDIPATLEFEEETGSIYVRVSTVKVKKTFEVEEKELKVLIDLDENGILIGIELIGLLRGGALARRKP